MQRHPDPSQRPQANTFAAALRAQKELLDLSLQTIATRAGMPKATVEAAMRDKPMSRGPDLDTVIRLARALEMSDRHLRLLVAQSLGLLDDPGHDVALERGDLEGLTPRQVTVLRQLARVMREPGEVAGTPGATVHPARRAARSGSRQRADPGSSG